MRFVFVLFILIQTYAFVTQSATQSDVKITVLSTMVADYKKDPTNRTFLHDYRYTHSEWGYAALIETGGDNPRKILFDTGANPQTILKNAKGQKIDLTDVTDIVISHHHADHTGGLLPILRHLQPGTNVKVHVGHTILWPRHKQWKNETHGEFIEVQSTSGETVKVQKRQENKFDEIFRQANAISGIDVDFKWHEESSEMFQASGIFLITGIENSQNEINLEKAGLYIKQLGQERYKLGYVTDELSLAIKTPDGLIVMSGCGHRGAKNTVMQSINDTGDGRVLALTGGFHLLGKTDRYLKGLAELLSSKGIKAVWGAHCTGDHAHHVLHNEMNRSSLFSSVWSFFKFRKPEGEGEENPNVQVLRSVVRQSFHYKDGEEQEIKVSKSFYR